MEDFWTAAGEEASWTAHARSMVQSSPSHLLDQALMSTLGVKEGFALDLGCGTGRHFAPLSQRGFHVIGIDATLAAVQLSLERAEAARIPASPVCAIAQLLPVRS